MLNIQSVEFSCLILVQNWLEQQELKLLKRGTGPRTHCSTLAVLEQIRVKTLNVEQDKNLRAQMLKPSSFIRLALVLEWFCSGFLEPCCLMNQPVFPLISSRSIVIRDVLSEDVAQWK